MHFEGRKASEITEREIEDLVAAQVAEDGILDFKRDCYPANDSGKKEFLRDVVSFANADGGYILIGIEENGGGCATSLVQVADAAAEVGRLRDLCLQCIQPRIRDLEIVTKSVSSNTAEIIVIHIPESGSRPHMMTIGDGTYFCKRYQDRKRSMSIEELREAFGRQTQILRTGMPESLQSDIKQLAAIMGANRLESLTQSEPISKAVNGSEVRRIMELRFRKQAGERPYFRMTSLPEDIRLLDLSFISPEVVGILRSPPQTRKEGWSIWPARDVKRTTEGWSAEITDDEFITILDNGCVEFFMPCDGDLFQWGRQSSGDSTPELFPFALCELPVNFTRLAKAVYTAASYQGQLIFELEFANIRGYMLRPGVPNSMVYMMPSPLVDTKTWPDNDLAGIDVTVSSDFEPDKLAFQLVERVYQAFGISRKYIPCFDRERRFDINVNSAED